MLLEAKDDVSHIIGSDFVLVPKPYYIAISKYQKMYKYAQSLIFLRWAKEALKLFLYEQMVHISILNKTEVCC